MKLNWDEPLNALENPDYFFHIPCHFRSAQESAATHDKTEKTDPDVKASHAVHTAAKSGPWCSLPCSHTTACVSTAQGREPAYTISTSKHLDTT